MLQSRVVSPYTERFFRSAGIVSGMRVLDLGSGVGDVALLVADIVGPGGYVLGLDRDAKALDHAQQRTAEQGCSSWVSFQTVSLEDFSTTESPFGHTRTRRTSSRSAVTAISCSAFSVRTPFGNGWSRTVCAPIWNSLKLRAKQRIPAAHVQCTADKARTLSFGGCRTNMRAAENEAARSRLDIIVSSYGPVGFPGLSWTDSDASSRSSFR